MQYPAPPGPDTIRLIGIDPGTDTLGIAIIDVDMVTYEAVLVYAETFKASKAVKGMDWYIEMRGGRDARLESHKTRLYEFFCTVTPTLVAAESPFLKRARVSAFEALVECYAMLRNTLWEYSPGMYLRRIDPISAKNYCGVSHVKTDKSDMYRAITAEYADKHLPCVPLNDLDEHSIDAVAVAHCLYRKYLLGVELASTKKSKRPKVAGEKKRRRRRRKRK